MTMTAFITSALSSSPQRSGKPLFETETFFPCFFSLSPMEDNLMQKDAEHQTHTTTSHDVILPAIVFLFWLFLLHVPFQMVGSCVAAALKQLDFIAIDEDLPWYQIDPILRISTTVADAARILFWVGLRSRYDAAMEGVYERQRAVEKHHQSENHTDYKSIGDINDSSHNINPFTSSILPSREWINLAFWSTLAWPLRMGDSFQLASTGSHDESFWTPLKAYGVSRVAALAIGAIPGCIGGIPSLMTSLGLGILYASYREQFERKVEVLLDGRSDETEVEAEVREQNSSWGYRLRTVLGYAYFTCFMVLWDAIVLNGALRKKVKIEES
eukprot:CAMPEP_0201699172 /NCGR_PEP_ID=MMETSP0578-20130828/22660_1 /ASSEMBLY_ACC=CAM_ASM_000663 /TAXON_ID=267565 /ORGANISM="Skeletonema grethea, Strain CCMP 1804" /LENGTH=327 /DNA_ID=CAMNT_0048185877 /DNA_START=98 /DNA_END=1081 /DNA_ORIENTATION=+